MGMSAQLEAKCCPTCTTECFTSCDDEAEIEIDSEEEILPDTNLKTTPILPDGSCEYEGEVYLNKKKQLCICGYGSVRNEETM